MKNQQGAPEALRLADIADDEAWAFVIGVRKEIAAELRRLHAENERLQQELIRESHRTAEQKLRTDQMTRQHADQAAMNREARAQLAALVEAQQPAAHVQKPAEIEHVAGDVSKNGAESNMAQQPAPSAAAAVVVYEQKENEMQVWFRPARMYGHPERTPIKATITKDRGNGIVDLTYDDGEFSGNARAVPNALRLPRNVREQVAVWWDVGFEMDFQTAVDNSLKKKKDAPPPQPSPTPQADSQPAPDEIINMAREQGLPETEIEGVFRVNVDDLGRMFAADRAASAPADSATAPAGGLGWKLVPMEITDAMRNAAAQAGMEALDLRDAGASNVGLVPKMYEAMLAAAPTPPAQAADSVQEDAARLDWLLLRISGAEFRRIGVHYSGNARRADVDAARKQGANHD